MLSFLAHNRAPRAEIEAHLATACPAIFTAECSAWAAAIHSPEQASAQLRLLLRSVEDKGTSAAGSIALAAAYGGDTALALDALEVFVCR